VSTEPDVSVIVPVYNTMPYLTECLDSLVAQTIGAERMEIVAVDDGSTDGSGKELDRFAQQHPGVFTVLHQENSGGPAAPNNRGLELAAGRYIYFVGADDYLHREALRRMVDEADEHGSDVVAGRMVGVNGRYVHQEIYASTDHDVQLYDSSLPWSMSNAKLFRRELVERHSLRYREHVPVGSDQIFTLEACVRARRISVLADDTYYFAVLRTDSSNITYRTPPEVNLACAREIMTAAAQLIGTGPQRDAILRRHFAWELYKVLTVGFLELDPSRQEALCRGVAALADEFLTDAIHDSLTVRRRVLVCLAQAGELDILREVVRQQAEDSVPPVVLDAGHAYLAYAGFRGGRPRVADRCYEIIGAGLAGQIAARVELLSLRWEKGRHELDLVVALRVGMSGPAAVDAATVRLAAVPVGEGHDGAPFRGHDHAGMTTAVPVSLEAVPEHAATLALGRLPMGPLLDSQPTGTRKWAVRLLVDLAGTTHEVPVPDGRPPTWRRRGHRGRAYRVSARASHNARLMLTAHRIPRRELWRARLRTLKSVVGRR
jgi:poly(ribitol-phosphate) beta-N-acetylglucosaminyltransferase